MKPPLHPLDEVRRLDALRQYQILDTLPDEALDDLTELAAAICEAPIALVSLVDADRQWFKSRRGFPFTETPRDVSFCGHAIVEPGLFMVADATQDARFADNPLVTHDPHIRFYAGAPLIAADGQTLGTLCVMDRVPRRLTASQQHALCVLSRQVIAQFDLHRQTRMAIAEISERKQAEAQLREASRFTHATIDAFSAHVCVLDETGTIVATNEAWRRFARTNRPLGRDAATGDNYLEICDHTLGPDAGDARAFASGIRYVLRSAVPVEFAMEYPCHSPAEERWFLGRVTRFAGEGPIGVVVAHENVTARKRAEAVTSRLAAIVEFSDDAMIGKDLNGIVTTWNAGAAKIFGYAANEMIGQSIMRLIPDDRRAEEMEILERLRRGESAEHFETIRQTKDGRLITVSVTASPIKDAAGRVIGASKVARDITERTRAEAAQHASQALLANILNSTPSYVFATDRQHTYTLVNEGYARFLGRPADEIVGRTHHDFFSRDVADGFVAANNAIMDSGDITQIDEVVLGATLLTVKFPLRDARGAVTGLCAVVTDITARTRAEEARLASEARYRALFEYAPDGILMADREGRYVDANASICRMLGYTCEELIGRQASDIVTPSEMPHIEPALRAIVEQGDYHREWQFRRKDGSVFAAEVMATEMPDGNLLAVVRDVTERNQAVDAVRTAEERMRFALEAASVGIWDMDFTTGILRWSDTLEAQYGLAAGTFAGTFGAFMSRVHPADRESVRETMGRAVAAGQDFSEQHRAQWPDGTVRWLDGFGRILLGARGEPLRGVGISLDVTERHDLEAQYQQAQKMEAIGRLAGGVAHDFNNLLTAILGYCELLLTGLPPGDVRARDIGQIQKAGLHAAGLTRQLLAFSRKQIVEPVRLNLNVIVTEMQPMLARLIGEDVEVRLRLDANLAIVNADRGQVEQIVMNLAVNARDAMPLGGQLTIETANVDLDEHYGKTHFAVTPGPYVMLAVSDTGIGMTPEVQARLFEPFFTTKELGKGTGLGLATVHGIVTRNEGSVRVYSEVGQGTSFKVYLPRAAGGPAAVEAAPAKPLPQPGTGTILVVEDAEGLRELTQRLLERLGYTVLIAADPAEALRLFESHASIDVVLTDVVMPGGSGPELIRTLLERRPSVKVIYMSGYTDEAIVHHGILNPGVAFLQKPFSSETLARKIRELLSR
jgi:two-component system cell cycle sensor histidine kinase/response regulator CckA